MSLSNSKQNLAESVKELIKQFQGHSRKQGLEILRGRDRDSGAQNEICRGTKSFNLVRHLVWSCSTEAPRTLSFLLLFPSNPTLETQEVGESLQGDRVSFLYPLPFHSFECFKSYHPIACNQKVITHLLRCNKRISKKVGFKIEEFVYLTTTEKEREKREYLKRQHRSRERELESLKELVRKENESHGTKL